MSTGASYRSRAGGVSFKAGGTIHISRFVKFDTVAFQLLESTSGDASMGIMQEGQRDPPGVTGSDATIAALIGDKATFNVYQQGDKCRVWLIAGVTAGSMLKASTGGKAIGHTTGSAFVGAVALTNGNADELIEALVLDPNNYATLP